MKLDVVIVRLLRQRSGCGSSGAIWTNGDLYGRAFLPLAYVYRRYFSSALPALSAEFVRAEHYCDSWQNRRSIR